MTLVKIMYAHYLLMHITELNAAIYYAVSKTIDRLKRDWEVMDYLGNKIYPEMLQCKYSDGQLEITDVSGPIPTEVDVFDLHDSRVIETDDECGMSESLPEDQHRRYLQQFEVVKYNSDGTAIYACYACSGKIPKI